MSGVKGLMVEEIKYFVRIWPNQRWPSDSKSMDSEQILDVQEILELNSNIGPIQA